MRQPRPPIILPLTTSYQRQAYTLLCGMSHHIHAVERTQRHPVPLASPAALITRAKPAANCGMPDRPLYRCLSSPLAQGAASSTSPALQNHHEIRCSEACSPPRLPVVITRGVHAASPLLPPARPPRPHPHFGPLCAWPAPAAHPRPCGKLRHACMSVIPLSRSLRVLRVLRGAFRLLPYARRAPRCREAAPERASLTTACPSRIVGSPTSPTNNLLGRNGTFDTRPPGVRRGILHMTRSTHC